MTPRESFHAMMAGERPDTLCQFEWGYWPETVDRWRQEGLREGVEPWDDCGIITYLRPEIERLLWPAFEVIVLDEDEDTLVLRNEMGVVCRESKRH